MSEFHVDALKRRLIDVARPNLFKVSIFPPSFVKWDGIDDDMLLVKTAKLPSITNKEYVYERAGQKIHLPTHNYDFGEATITFYCDVEYKLRNKILEWQKAMSDWRDNSSYRPLSSVNSSIQIFQYNNVLEKSHGVELSYAWPSMISDIELSQDSENTAGTFSVEFKYAYQKLLQVT